MTTYVINLLSHKLPQLSDRQFWRRFAIVNDMVLNGLTQLGNGKGARFEELLDMPVASLQAGTIGTVRAGVTVGGKRGSSSSKIRADRYGQ
jgi:hypothetical protein